MPLKWILHWQPNAGTTVNSQILTEVSQCVESINGTKDGRWKSTLTFYKPMLRDPNAPGEYPRDFLGISLQEQPNKYYCIVRGQKIVLEADSSIQMIMEKLQSYKSRVSLNFEPEAEDAIATLKGNEESEARVMRVFQNFYLIKESLASFMHLIPKNLLPAHTCWEGFQYKLGDFKVRVGKVVLSHNESLRGIVMEVEYLPISSLEKSRQIMEEFVDIWQETISRKLLPGHFMHIDTNFPEYGLSDHYSSQHTAVQYATVMAQLIATVRS